MRFTRLFPGAMLMLAAVAVVHAQNPQNRQTPQKPQTPPASQTAEDAAQPEASFVATAHADGEAEIALADLAATRSQSAGVKALASKIKSDHQQAGEQLKQLAAQKNVTLSSTLSPAHKNTMNRLGKLSGAAFDRAYVSAMVTDHQKAIAEFTKTGKGADADIKAFAARTLPALREHLRHAQELQKKGK